MVLYTFIHQKLQVSQKVMATGFWDRKWIIQVDSTSPGTRINATTYYETVSTRHSQEEGNIETNSACFMTTLETTPWVSPLRFRKQVGSSKHTPQSGPSANGSVFPLSSNEKSQWGKVRRRWWNARRSHGVVQSADVHFYDVQHQELTPRLDKC